MELEALAAPSHPPRRPRRPPRLRASLFHDGSRAAASCPDWHHPARSAGVRALVPHRMPGAHRCGERHGRGIPHRAGRPRQPHRHGGHRPAARQGREPHRDGNLRLRRTVPGGGAEISRHQFLYHHSLELRRKRAHVFRAHLPAALPPGHSRGAEDADGVHRLHQL